jgi:signal transduction histidine kinase
MSNLSIYLAGPITGVDREVSTGWREQFIVKYGDKFDIYNPFDRDYAGKTGDELYAAIANGERRDILNCDVTLAYVDRPSMGTAMGIMYAFLSGRTVVVVRDNSDSKLSEMVLHHAHIICSSFEEAVKFIKKRHRRSTIKTILKRSGEEVPWDPQRIEKAIQDAIDGNADKLNALEVGPPRADKLATTVVMQIEDALTDGRLSYVDLDVETVQDMVEKVLMDNSHRMEVHTLAKEYITYRRKKQEIREKNISDDETLNFIKDMLHDIKSPTGNIGRLCQFLKEYLGNEDLGNAGETLEEIEENQQHMMSLIIDCKMRGEKRFKREPLDIKEFIEKEFNTYGQNDINLCSYVTESILVEVRPYRFRTIFRNLLDNSIKHGLPEGKGNIFIRANKLKDSKILIEYWNDGKPVSKNVAEQIFSDVKKQSADSEGFQHGMLQVRRYVEELGGTIDCIPMSRASNDDPTPLKQEEEGMPVFRIVLPEYKGEKQVQRNILVADDVSVDRKSMIRILTRANYNIIEADTIDKAIDIIEKEDLYGAVLDVDFKEERDGIFLLKHLREQKPDVRTIVVSGSDSSSASRGDWRTKAEKYGAIRVFDKASYTAKDILLCFRA